MFSDVKFTYGGKDYTVKSDQVLMCIARVEGVITLGELVDTSRPQNAKLAMAYGEALRFAGAVVSNEELYLNIFKDGAAQSMGAAVGGLLSLMIPPEALQEKAGTAEKKPVRKKRSS